MIGKNESPMMIKVFIVSTLNRESNVQKFLQRKELSSQMFTECKTNKHNGVIQAVSIISQRRIEDLRNNQKKKRTLIKPKAT